MSSLSLSSDDEDEEEEEGGGLEILMEAPEGFRNSDEDRFSESQVNRVQVVQCNCTDGNHHTYIDIVLSGKCYGSSPVLFTFHLLTPVVV